MDARARFAVLASSAVVCLGVMFSPVSSAGETPISLRYAGRGWDTHVEGYVQDRHNVSLTTGTAQGTLGNSTITITTEFTPTDAVTCPVGFPLRYALVYSAAVLTFPDQSQLFGISQTGWICATEGASTAERSVAPMWAARDASRRPPVTMSRSSMHSISSRTLTSGRSGAR